MDITANYKVFDDDNCTMKAIMVIGYGSSMPYAADTVRKQAERLAARRGERVYTAFHRADEPLIADAMRKAAEDGVDELLVIPYFIADGTITKEYLPREIGLEGYGDGVAEVEGRRISVRFGRAVGSDPGVADVVLRTIEANGGDAEKTGILIVGHGSEDRSNSEAVESVATAVASKGYKVFVGYNEFCGPTIEESFHKALEVSEDRVIVVPMFIACGLHLKEEIPQKIGLRKNSRGGIIHRNGKAVEIRYASAVGEDPYMADVMAAEAERVFGR